MKEIDRDIDGMASETKATMNGRFFPADKVTLDEKGKSFVYDFAEDKEIQKIELFKTNLEKKSRIRERDLHIYTKQNADDGWTELTPDSWNYVVDSRNQSIHFNFKNALKTRFIKIRTIWDDRNIDNENVSDYVTFTNDSVQKMIRIWTLDDKRNEAYSYDKNSNRTSLTENGKVRNYNYYKNAVNGNTARVMYDGKWWYTYDANGNRTARARTAIRNENTVTLDKTGEYWEYTWDYHNRLIKVEQYNAPDNVQNVKVEYTYDAMNRRIERVSYTSETSVKTQYAYGRNGAMTYQKKTEGNSVTYRSFVYLNNQIAGFMDTENGTEKIRYAVTDIQGSVTEVYDENSRLLWKSGYTAFGIKAGETTNLIDFDGLYTGCDYDAETGLTYHWNRWRSEDGDSWLSEDPIRDGINWYTYCGGDPLNNIDENGLETWRSSTLTRDEYDNNYQLQRQYSWEQVQQHFADNPNGIIYRYDTMSYSLGKSNKDIPNMEKPGAELALGLASFSKLAGSKVISWIKNGFKSAVASSAMDTTLQLTNMAKNENQSFNTNELLNTTVGGFVSGFVTGGIASIPSGGSPNVSIILSNAVGGFSGSMTSQLMNNVQNGNFLFEGMDSAYMYGTAGGLMVGGVNVCFPTILPGNIGQIIKDQIVSSSTEQFIEEKMNEKCTKTGK